MLLIVLYKMNKHDHEVIRQVIAQKHESGTCTISDSDKKRIERIAGHNWEDMWIGKSAVERKIEEFAN